MVVVGVRSSRQANCVREREYDTTDATYDVESHEQGCICLPARIVRGVENEAIW